MVKLPAIGQRSISCGKLSVNQAAQDIAAFYPPSPYTFPPSIFLLSPTSNAVFKAGENIKLTAAATDIDGKVARVEYWLQSGSGDYWMNADLPVNRIATSTGASKNFPALWRKPPQGNYSLVAVAYDNQGASSISDPVPFNVVPHNDDFANAQIISGSLIAVDSPITAATLEPGEPVHTNPLNPDAWGSIWYSWTAPASGWANISCNRSPIATVDVYQGTALTNLTQITNDSYNSDSTVSFQAVAGNTYYIAGTSPSADYFFDVSLTTIVVTSPTNGAHFPYGTPIPISLTTTKIEGPIRYVEFRADGYFLGSIEKPPYSMLWTNASQGEHEIIGHVVTVSGRSLFAPASPTISVGPSNDDFARSQIITNEDFQILDSLDGATMEPGEPPVISGYTNSIWFSFTAQHPGVVSMLGYSSNDQTIEVFEGNSLADLVLITNALNRLAFDLTEGNTYSMRISGYPNDVRYQFFTSTFEITSPPSGSQFPSGANIPITIDFAERDEAYGYGPIRYVKFYANDIPIGTVYDPPFSFVWSNVLAGSYQLRAVGTNNYDFLFHASALVPITVLPP